MKILRIRVARPGPASAGWQIGWALVENSTLLSRGEGETNWPAADRVELVLAADLARVLNLTLPRASRGQLRQALPALAEPQVLGPLEDSHFASHKLNPGEPNTVAVVERTLLAELLEMLRRLQQIPAAAWVEAQGLPGPGPSLLWESSGGFIQLPDGSTQSLDRATLERPALGLELALGNAGDRPLVLWLRPCAAAPDLAAWSATLGRVIHNAGRWSWETAVFEGRAINLLQGEFSPPRTGIDSRRLGRIAGLGLAALLLVELLGLGGTWFSLARENRALRAERAQLFLQAFPDTKAVVDPLAQAQNRLTAQARQRGQFGVADFLPLAARLGTAWPAGSPGPARLDYASGQIKALLPAGLSATPPAGLEALQEGNDRYWTLRGEQP